MAVIIQRPLKGSRISSFYPVKSLPPLSALDSAFQLQEYISLLIRLDVHDVERIVSIPGKGSSEGQDSGDTKGEDKDGEKDGSGSINVDEAFSELVREIRRYNKDLQPGRPTSAPTGPGVFNGAQGVRDDVSAGCCGGCVIV